MMTYIFIGVILLIVLAILFTLRSYRKKDKLIKDLRYSAQKREELIEKNRDFFISKMSIQSQTIDELTQQRNFYRELLVDGLVEKLESVLLPDEQLKRWGQLVTDCKKPFERKKVPINIGGKFTRSMIIAVDDIVNVVSEIANKHKPEAQ